jgi:hypothetical protein
MQIPATPVVANWLEWGFPFRRTHCIHNKLRYPLELEDSIKSDIKLHSAYTYENNYKAYVYPKRSVNENWVLKLNQIV